MSPLVERARLTHLALYGKEPPYEPYRGASDTPFEGIDPDLMRELVNIDEVNRHFREFTQTLKNRHRDIGVYSYVSLKKKPTQGLVSIKTTPEWVLCYHIPSGVLGYRLRKSVKSRVPEAGERDTMELALRRTIEEGARYTEGARIVETSTGREGVILSDFCCPLRYKDATIPVIPFSGIVEIEGNPSCVPIHKVCLIS